MTGFIQQTIGGLGKALGDIVGGVGTAISNTTNTINHALDVVTTYSKERGVDPVPIVETYVLVQLGVPPAVATSAVSAMNGGKPEDIAKAYVAGQVGAGAGGAAGSAVTEAGYSEAMAKVAASAVGASTTAVVRSVASGKTIGEALQAGLVAGGIGGGVEGFTQSAKYLYENIPQLQSQAESAYQAVVGKADELKKLYNEFNENLKTYQENKNAYENYDSWMQSKGFKQNFDEDGRPSGYDDIYTNERWSIKYTIDDEGNRNPQWVHDYDKKITAPTRDSLGEAAVAAANAANTVSSQIEKVSQEYNSTNKEYQELKQQFDTSLQDYQKYIGDTAVQQAQAQEDAQRATQTQPPTEVAAAPPANTVPVQMPDGSVAYYDGQNFFDPSGKPVEVAEVKPNAPTVVAGPMDPDRIEVGGVPIYKENLGDKQLNVPKGYELLSTSEADSKPAGSFYDEQQNAWFKPVAEVPIDVVPPGGEAGPAVGVPPEAPIPEQPITTDEILDLIKAGIITKPTEPVPPAAEPTPEEPAPAPAAEPEVPPATQPAPEPAPVPAPTAPEPAPILEPAPAREPAPEPAPAAPPVEKTITEKIIELLNPPVPAPEPAPVSAPEPAPVPEREVTAPSPAVEPQPAAPEVVAPSPVETPAEPAPSEPGPLAPSIGEPAPVVSEPAPVEAAPPSRDQQIIDLINPPAAEGGGEAGPAIDVTPTPGATTTEPFEPSEPVVVEPDLPVGLPEEEVLPPLEDGLPTGLPEEEVLPTEDEPPEEKRKLSKDAEDAIRLIAQIGSQFLTAKKPSTRPFASTVNYTGQGFSPGSAALAQALRTDAGEPIFGGEKQKGKKAGWNVESLRYMGDSGDK